MPIFKGFVRGLTVREDGWIACELLAPHAGNTVTTLFLPDLDGDVNETNRRLAKLGLLRDALARSLPVEVVASQRDGQGLLIEDVEANTRPSLDGRPPSGRREGTVVALSITERTPASGASPYLDPSDLAAVALLLDDGSLEIHRLDLQRPDVTTGHAMLTLLAEARRTRRRVALLVSKPDEAPHQHEQVHYLGAGIKAVSPGASVDGGGFVVGVEWVPPSTAELDETYAYVERISQRSESWQAIEAPLFSHATVTYTTAPAQTPEGDVSDNGSFIPQRRTARVHCDSPLLQRLEHALRDRLQVRLGLDDDLVHEVVLVADLGSVARPIWLEITRRVLPPPEPNGDCDNTPTVATPGPASFATLPHVVAWEGNAYFNRGVWRFVVDAPGCWALEVDGRTPCGGLAQAGGDNGHRPLHAYLDGVHRMRLVLHDHTCSDQFALRVYRIR